MELLSPELLAQIGFPICVTIYLLFERSKFNADITVKLEKITNLLDKLEMKIDVGLK